MQNNKKETFKMRMAPSMTVRKEEVKQENAGRQYSCWGCKASYHSPAEFLWHIQSCSLAKK